MAKFYFDQFNFGHLSILLIVKWCICLQSVSMYSVLSDLWNVVVSADVCDQIPPTFGRMALCRVYTAICASKGTTVTTTHPLIFTFIGWARNKINAFFFLHELYMKNILWPLSGRSLAENRYYWDLAITFLKEKQIHHIIAFSFLLELINW